MAYSLTNDDIGVLKELKGAGARGRNIDQARLALRRLMKVGYVRQSAIRRPTTFTDFGRIALDNEIAGR